MGALALTLLLGAQIVYLRGALRRNARREQAAIAVWRPHLNAALAGVAPAALPVLRRRERIVFLKLWVHLHQSVRGDASAGLNEVGYRLGCDAIARALMRRGNRPQRLLAVLALGHLRDITAWPVLLDEANRTDRASSVHAVWALVQIDPAAATRHLMPLLLARDDWALSQVATILQDAREYCGPALAEAIARMPPERLPRALHLAEALRVPLPSALLAELLRHASVEVVAAALRLAASPDLLGEVRANLAHADWRARVQAAKALGRIGDRSDIARLRALLGDPQWWVRYRAAQALAGMPLLSPADLDALCGDTSDRFAIDILRQVRAEQDTP